VSNDAIKLFSDDSLTSFLCSRYFLLKLNKLGITLRARANAIPLYNLLVMGGDALLFLEHELSSALISSRNSIIEQDGPLTVGIEALLPKLIMTSHSCIRWAPLLRNLMAFGLCPLKLLSDLLKS